MLAVAAKMHQHKAEHRQKNCYFEVLSCFVPFEEKILVTTYWGDLKQKEKNDMGKKTEAYDLQTGETIGFFGLFPSSLQNIKHEIHIWHY